MGQKDPKRNPMSNENSQNFTQKTVGLKIALSRQVIQILASWNLTKKDNNKILSPNSVSVEMSPTNKSHVAVSAHYFDQIY